MFFGVAAGAAGAAAGGGAEAGNDGGDEGVGGAAAPPAELDRLGARARTPPRRRAVSPQAGKPGDRTHEHGQPPC